MLQGLESARAVLHSLIVYVELSTGALFTSMEGLTDLRQTLNRLKTVTSYNSSSSAINKQILLDVSTLLNG